MSFAPACSPPSSSAVAPPKRAVAVPQDAVVREGDGTMTVWTTADRRRFEKREIETG